MGLILNGKSLWLETVASCESNQERSRGKKRWRGLGKSIANRNSARERILISQHCRVQEGIKKLPDRLMDFCRVGFRTRERQKQQAPASP